MTTLTPDTLRTYGEALYGPRWQSELARALDVSDRTMRRWLAGATEMPNGLEAELSALKGERIKQLRAL